VHSVNFAAKLVHTRRVDVSRVRVSDFSSVFFGLVTGFFQASAQMPTRGICSDVTCLTLPYLVHTRRALSSTVIKSHQEPVSGQARNPRDPLLVFFFSFDGGALRYPVPNWLLFLNKSGVFFHCLRSYFLYYYFDTTT